MESLKKSNAGSEDDITAMLMAVSAGNIEAWNRLVPAVYREIKNLARFALNKERRGHTLQATELTHELFARLLNRKEVQWENRAHFYRAAAMALNWILVDHERHRRKGGRPGSQGLLHLDPVDAPEDPRAYSKKLKVLDMALWRLENHGSLKRKCRVVNLRFFMGLTFQEIARELDVSATTAKNDWYFARAWLLREMRRIECHGA